MRYTLFGRTGLRVSEIALGTMTFGDDWGWGAPKETAGAILDTYAEAGGNVLDTANAYTDGTAETMLGELLAGRRDEFVVATKYTAATRPTDPNSGGNHRKNLVNAVEASLRRLRTDRVDVLWVHARDVFTPVEEVMRALDDQVRAGKVHYVAVSDWPAWEVAQANTLAELRGWSAFAGLQIRYNLLDRTPERDLLPMAESFDLPVVAWAPIAAGKLSGKYLRGESGRLDVRTDHDTAGGRDDEIVRAVVEIADQGGWTPTQVAIGWLLGRPGNVIPLVGATTQAQLRDNLGAVEVRLDDDQRRRLDELTRVDLGFPHEFLAEAGVRQFVYGSRWDEIDDRRTTHRRVLS